MKPKRIDASADHAFTRRVASEPSPTPPTN